MDATDELPVVNQFGLFVLAMFSMLIYEKAVAIVRINSDLKHDKKK